MCAELRATFECVLECFGVVLVRCWVDESEEGGRESGRADLRKVVRAGHSLVLQNCKASRQSAIARFPSACFPLISKPRPMYMVLVCAVGGSVRSCSSRSEPAHLFSSSFIHRHFPSSASKTATRRYPQLSPYSTLHDVPVQAVRDSLVKSTSQKRRRPLPFLPHRQAYKLYHMLLLRLN